MKKFSPVVVAFVSFCLISFHSNPTSAAVIDAGAPPEDAALAVPLELEELDDGTGKWNNNTVLANKSPTTKRKIEIDCCVRLIICLASFCFVLFCFVLFLPF